MVEASATFNLDVVLNVIDKTTTTVANKFDKLSVYMKDTYKQLAKGFDVALWEDDQFKNFEKFMKRAGVTVLETGQTMDLTTMKIIDMKDAIKKLHKATKPFSFDFLTFIFAGMMLQRTFGGFFKSMKETYREIAGENDVFIQRIDALSGAFDYLKFSLFNAFANTPFVQKAIDQLTKALVGLAEFLSDHPKLSTTLVAIVGALATLGTISVTIGGLKQLGMLVGLLKDLPTSIPIKLNVGIVPEILTWLSTVGTVSIYVGIALASYWVGTKIGDWLADQFDDWDKAKIKTYLEIYLPNLVALTKGNWKKFLIDTLLMTNPITVPIFITVQQLKQKEFEKEVTENFESLKQAYIDAGYLPDEAIGKAISSLSATYDKTFEQIAQYLDISETMAGYYKEMAEYQERFLNDLERIKEYYPEESEIDNDLEKLSKNISDLNADNVVNVADAIQYLLSQDLDSMTESVNNLDTAITTYVEDSKNYLIPQFQAEREEISSLTESYNSLAQAIREAKSEFTSFSTEGAPITTQ